MTARFRSPRAALCALLVLAPAALGAQVPAGSGALPAGMARAAPGPEYHAGGLRRFLLGDGYRALWAAPILVPLLVPDTFAGGLAVVRQGGGLSTEALRMAGRDGRQYVFRSVDKNLTPAMPPDLRGTLPHAIVQDLVSAEHPGAALVAAPLLRTAGVLRVTPRVYQMPAHPFLREHHALFEGRMGMVELRPTDGFASAADVKDSEDFQRLLEADPQNRVNAHAFLTARLMDVYLGDWDRRWSQWRWARFDDAGLRWWSPIPRDRDNAFFDAHGLIPSLARSLVPTLVHFGPRIDGVMRYHAHSAEVDRRLLSELPREVWDSVALSLRARLTDAAIDSAVRRLPPEYLAIGGEELAAALGARREELPAAAARFYRMTAREVDVHATDRAERVEVYRFIDGSMDVTVRAPGDPEGWPSFHRRFWPGETREVRLYLHGGNDLAVVRGAPYGMRVRVIGGGGDDALLDQTGDRGRTVLYDDRGSDHAEGARIDTRSWTPPPTRSLVGNPPRDWGTAASLLTPYAAWELDSGPVVGAGPTWTRYGFRRSPYATQLGVRLLWAPMESGVGAALRYDRRLTGRPASVWLKARGGTFDDVRFHGLGNDSPGDPDGDVFEVEQAQVRVQAAYEVRPTPRLRLSAGPAAAWTDPGDVHADPAGALGTESFWQAGAGGALELDGRDSEMDTRRGGRLTLAAEGYGTDVGGPFGRFEGAAAGYVSVPGRMGPTLALRVGGQAAVGDYPFQQSASAGGPTNLRGYSYERFRGDQSLTGSAELRLRIAYLNLGVARAHVGAFGLADAGRVYLHGDSPGGWHAGYGGGLSLRTLGQTGTVAYARGEQGIVYVTIGLPF